MTTDGSSMMSTFNFVRDSYKTAARMLLAADALLADRQLAVYPWHSIWPTRSTSLSKVDWIPTSVFRQYHSPEKKDREVITLAAVFYSLDDREIPEPLCIGSRMSVNAIPNDVYWWALVQRWAPTAAPPDGVVRVLQASDVRFASSDERQKFEDGVVAAKLATVAVPLLEIRGTSDLDQRILAPLLGFQYDAGGGDREHVAPAV